MPPCCCGLVRSGSAACHECAGRSRPKALLQVADSPCAPSRPEMSVRPPRSFSTGLSRETGWSVLDYEILQQKAQTLGTLGCQVEQALARLRAYDAGGPGADRDAQRCTCWMTPPSGSGPL